MRFLRFIRCTSLGFLFLIAVHVYIIWTRTPLSFLNEVSPDNKASMQKLQLQESQPLIKNAVATNIRDGGILVDHLALAQNLPDGYSIHFPILNESDKKSLPLFPFETIGTEDDRIWNQMRYVPKQLLNVGPVRDKLILFYNGLGVETGGREVLRERHCPVRACEITGDRERFTEAHVVLWQHVVSMPFKARPPGQIWAVFFLESPYHTPGFKLPGMNWTSTYRHTSTIVSPYYKFTPFDPLYQSRDSNTSFPFKLPSRNYAQSKTKKVAWFVSNCNTPNNRLKFAKELSNFIEVDIYGACGTRSCPRSSEQTCFSKLSSEYKFYLSFENSNCRDYITEKFFLNGLQQDVLPVVMGAHPEDYARQAPPHSFVHVGEFASAKDLAQYLLYLDKNDDAYNSYFAWKGSGIVDTNTHFLCRLCMMAHEAENVHSQVDHAQADKEWKESCQTTPWVTPKPLEQHLNEVQRVVDLAKARL